MNKWARRRKRIILGMILLALVIVVGIPSFFLFYKAPTCFDGKMNGDETGVDCGGSCRLICSNESLPIITLGDPRVLTVAENLYEVVVRVENPNTSAEVNKAEYVFKVFGNNNSSPLKVINGSTYVPKSSRFVIFEGPFNLSANSLPTRATFEWVESSLVWEENKARVPELLVSNKVLKDTDTQPRLTADVANLSLESASDIDLVATITDEGGNIFAASRTVIDTISPGEVVPIVFTWPSAFSLDALGYDITVRVFPRGGLNR